MDLRTTARRIFTEALAQTQIAPALTRKVPLRGSHLHIGSTALDLNHFPDIRVIALGKAALPMADALLAHLRPVLNPTHHLRGFVLSATLPATPDPRLIYRVGAHPTLNQTSLDAAHAVLDLLTHTTPQTLVFFLISGGASAMVDLPLLSPGPTVPPVSLEDLTAFHQTLVHAGLPIAAMNTLRKHVSAIKGGRLALAAAPATQITLLVSDVPPSRPDLIASGPTLPDPTTLDECHQLIRSSPLARTALPASIRALLLDPRTPETPKAGHPAFAQTTVHTLLSSNDLVHAAHNAATTHGFHTTVDLTPDDWPFDHAAGYLLARLHRLAEQNPTRPICLLSAGELTVPISTPTPGLGGRNQHFALHCALEITGTAYPTAVLSAGSDGIDGASPAAGAVVDHTTLARAERLGLDPQRALAAFNSYPLLHALGDTLVTGPTGNNLRDLRILLAAPRRPV